MIHLLKCISFSLFLLVCITTVNAGQPPQKPQQSAAQDDGSIQTTTFQYLSTKLRDGIFPDRNRRDVRYRQNVPPPGPRLLNPEKRQGPATNSSTTSNSSTSPTTVPSTSPTSSLPSQTTTSSALRTSTATKSSPLPSSSTSLSTITYPDGSQSTVTDVVVVTPTALTTRTPGSPSTTPPSLQGGAASATIGLKNQMLAMLGGAVVVAMAL
jgi:hypothetical protein